MTESYLWECVACCTVPYTDGGAPYHTAELWVVCDHMDVAKRLLQEEIIRKCDEYKFSMDQYEITTLKRGLRVVIP